MPTSTGCQHDRKNDFCVGSWNGSTYCLVVVCCAAQAATVVITWPLWQARYVPINLPVISLPAVSFGWLVLSSLLAVLACPRVGTLLHAVVILISIVFDQFRLQPQVVGIAVLMLAVVFQRTRNAACWYLAALWFWAGLHKLLSNDWFAQVSWRILGWLGLADAWHVPLAYSIAVGELILGLVAVFRPRWAAWGCIALHGGVAILFSPAVADWNRSVIPWNICLALVGPWLLGSARATATKTPLYWAIAFLLMASPVGFYAGVVPRAFAHILYSGNLPRGLITEQGKLIQIDGGKELQVPFPYSRGLLRQYFEQTASPGAKLHITGPCPWLVDAYFLKQTDGSTKKISRERFLTSSDGEVLGLEQDNPRNIFYLSLAHARLLKRTADGMIYAVQIPPEHYDPSLLAHLPGLPNLEQLQLAECSVRDDHLLQIAECVSLRAVGLSETDVTDDGIRCLMNMPKLEYFELDGTKTSPQLRRTLELQAARLQVEP